MEMSIEAVSIGLLRTVKLDVPIRPEELALIIKLDTAMWCVYKN